VTDNKLRETPPADGALRLMRAAQALAIGFVVLAWLFIRPIALLIAWRRPSLGRATIAKWPGVVIRSHQGDRQTERSDADDYHQTRAAM
jgi:hypothetical protein